MSDVSGCSKSRARKVDIPDLRLSIQNQAGDEGYRMHLCPLYEALLVEKQVELFRMVLFDILSKDLLQE